MTPQDLLGEEVRQSCQLCYLEVRFLFEMQLVNEREAGRSWRTKVWGNQYFNSDRPVIV